MNDDDEKTPIQCQACGGHWKIGHSGQIPPVTWCRWCIEGVMTAGQLLRWKKWKEEQRAKRGKENT